MTYFKQIIARTFLFISEPQWQASVIKLKSITKLFLLSILAFIAVNGCSIMPANNTRNVDHLVIRNLSNADIENVILSVPNTRRIIGTNRILKGADYSLRFPVTRAEDNPSYIEWQWQGRSFKRVLKASNEKLFFQHADGKTFTVKIELLNAGILNVFLE